MKIRFICVACGKENILDTKKADRSYGLLESKGRKDMPVTFRVKCSHCQFLNRVDGPGDKP